MCGSHIGDQDHREAVQGILEKIGLIEENLDIYKDYSLSNELRDKRITAHEEPRLVYNNCSGKHACMLAAGGNDLHPFLIRAIMGISCHKLFSISW